MLRIFKQYYPIRNALFVLGEGVFIFVAVLTSCMLLLGGYSALLQIDTVLKALLITIICQACIYYNDLYDLKVTDTMVELGIRLLQALGASAILLAGLYFLFPNFIIGEGVFIISLFFIIILIVSWRIGYTRILSMGLFNQKIIIIGSSNTAIEISQEIQEKKDSGYEIAAVITKKDWSDQLCSKEIGMICQESYDSICEISERLAVKKIIVALKEKRGAFPVKELLRCRVKGIDVIEGSTFYEMLTGKLIVDQINPSWLIFSKGFQKSRTQKIIKRAIDLVISLLMLIILLPLIVIVAIIIKLDSKGPILFSQERIGQNRKPYVVHKFRSMRSDAEKGTGPVWAKANDDRITKVGNFIRKTRIDEIPQLWNVLKGEMSLVGPRPERDHFIQELEKIIPYYGERFTVKPGLTGWAQVSYGYGATVEDAIEKLNYELFYIKNMSVLMDIMIVARTVKTVIFGMGQ
jgi:sugar transferase (PEP-CTERM system associated)